MLIDKGSEIYAAYERIFRAMNDLRVSIEGLKAEIEAERAAHEVTKQRLAEALGQVH